MGEGREKDKNFPLERKKEEKGAGRWWVKKTKKKGDRNREGQEDGTGPTRDCEGKGGRHRLGETEKGGRLQISWRPA